MKTRYIQIERAMRMMRRRNLMELWARGKGLVRVNPLKARRTNGRCYDGYMMQFAHIDEWR